AREDSEAPQRDLFVGLEQIKAPVHRGLECLMPGHGGAVTSGENTGALVEAPGEIVGAEDADPGCGELEGKGDAIEAVADLGNRGGVGRAQTETGMGGPG